MHVLGAAVYRTLSFISTDAHIVIVIVIFLGLDGINTLRYLGIKPANSAVSTNLTIDENNTMNPKNHINIKNSNVFCSKTGLKLKLIK